MPILAALVAGTLFGAGLTVAHMVDPRKVLDFLDFAAIGSGRWDPTLLMVFIGALPTMYVAYAAQRHWSRPLLEPSFYLVAGKSVDARLVAGSALFGIGWGMMGICPGPAVTALALVRPQIGNLLLFIGAMVAGILLSRLVRAGASVSAPATEPRT